ncbi:leucine-rich repeat-containing protein 51-like [Adelges cooleyi]|uniref:leucine-rich repeat-containing protein 51-like n=1 Tax=Adelges cooleyi TaxID=133065 RepID=UPI00217FCC25|nr:leucine-rich repeat-containing protein 51-like [Adelges cooleyi]
MDVPGRFSRNAGERYSSMLDYSFRDLESIGEIEFLKPRKGLRPYKCSASCGLYMCNAWRMNNNRLTNIRGIVSTAFNLLDRPEHLTWLDLSFNKITHLTNEIAMFPSLRVLYLHSNLLAEFELCLRHLVQIGSLYSLTLHDNLLDKDVNYRNKIVLRLKQIELLDFTRINEEERKRVHFYGRIRGVKNVAFQRNHQLH